MHEIKERLKKITWLRKIVRAIKAALKKARRPLDRFLSTVRLRRIAGKATHDPVRIGFIVQGWTGWDKMKPVYEAARARDNTETFLMVVPKDDFVTYEIVPDYTGNYFIENYPESIRMLDESGACQDPAVWDLDYLFYSRPYNYRLPAVLSAKRMARYTRCCYLPYGLNGTDALNYNNLFQDFYDDMYFIFHDSPHMRELFLKRYHFNYIRGIQHFEYLGYPALQMYLMMRDEDPGDGYITWTPRWDFDDKKGGSNFMEYKDRFLELAAEGGHKLLFRPHPAIRAEILRQQLMTKEEWEAYLTALSDLGVVTDITSPIEDILFKTRILISDFSSIVANFLMMGRPIIYCDGCMPLNEMFSEMLRYMYVADNWDEVTGYLAMLLGGDDPSRASRMKFIEDKYACAIGAGDRIIDRIIEDASVCRH